MAYSPYSSAIIVASIIFPLLAAVAIAARFKSWHIKSIALQADDYLILIALVRNSFHAASISINRR
jgi:hypothetical protein